MNDSLRTNVFVRFQPETIACACIYLAARALQVSIHLFLLALPFIANYLLSGKLMKILKAKAWSVISVIKLSVVLFFRFRYLLVLTGSCSLAPQKRRFRRYA